MRDWSDPETHDFCISQPDSCCFIPVPVAHGFFTQAETVLRCYRIRMGGVSRPIFQYHRWSSARLVVIHITLNRKKILRLHEQAGVRLTSLLELTQGFHCLPFMWSNFKGEIFFEHPFFLWFLFKWNSLWDSDIYVKIVRDKSLRQTLRGNPEVLSDAFPWQQHPKVWCTSSSKAQQRAFPWCLPLSLSLSLNPSHISNH